MSYRNYSIDSKVHISLKQSLVVRSCAKLQNISAGFADFANITVVAEYSHTTKASHATENVGNLGLMSTTHYVYDEWKVSVTEIYNNFSVE